MKMVRHGNGQMAENLATGKFQDVSLSSPEWQFREAISFQSTVVYDGCALDEQSFINLFCMLMVFQIL